MSASKESSYRLYIVLAGTVWCFYHPWQWPFVISLSSRFLTDPACEGGLWSFGCRSLYRSLFPFPFCFLP
ncbi:hypothetical protein Peur_067883 [Populus x canadensis]